MLRSMPQWCSALSPARLSSTSPRSSAIRRAFLLALMVALALAGPRPAPLAAADGHDHGHGHPSARGSQPPGVHLPHLPAQDEEEDDPAPEPVLEEEPGMDGDGTPMEGSEDEDGDGDAWDVNAPEGPTFTVDLDVTEGTWLSLDVSPDGREVVFDLLGDLYTVPIGGGEARSLTSGMAWDMQPTYSPDGQSIAFTSDRGGGDNLWIVSRYGGDPVQVTEESFRLLNSPAWSPDGRFLAARKHFTASRSLGSGEIWLYHRSGEGSGLQVTEKPNDQKDVGEPAFSPDGRYLYYSQDTTPGPIFEYNKDPNPGIYTIFRLDRETGETEALVEGAGGAVRPTPSPDGRLLAFVKRVRAKSVLYLKDLSSGEEWPVWDGLDRDMQQTWAIHGVYPRMAWTPDSREVVLWAGGKLQRIDVGSRVATEIPFQVQDSRTLLEVLRFPVEVAPERFHTQMLRWAEVSPQGDRVVYEALGKLWIRDLPEGTPRRLTSQEDHFELYPSFSRDGRSIVYTTWNDRDHGSVRVVPAAGGEGRALTLAPGHYVEPVFSPDGDQVVYRKTSGGYLTSPLWGMETGIYRVSARGDGGGGDEPVLLTDNGADPHFGADPDRLYLIRYGSDGRTLVSMGLDAPGLEGQEVREHASSTNGSRWRVSPDGQWLAWQERFNVYVTPFVATGKAVGVSTRGGGIPGAKVTREAGDYLHWSGDSTKLHWVLGPELFERALTDSFAFLEGAPEELPEPPTEGLDIGFDAAYDRPTGTTLALVGGRLLTMAGERGSERVIEDGVLVIEGDRITAVGSRGEVTIPAGAERIDVSGKTLMPGIVDVHWHGGQGSSGIIPQLNWGNAATLGFGVTTIHDPSNDTATIFAAAQMAKAGEILAPRIFSTGTILYGAETPFTAVVDSLEDAMGHLRRMKAVGAVSVKSYNQPRRDQRQQVVAAARDLEMMVVPEGGSLFEHNMTMVVDGHTGIEHSLPVGAIYDDVRQLWAATPVGYTPTLVVSYGGIWGENYWYATEEVWDDPRLTRFVPREILDSRSRRRTIAPEEEWGHFANATVAAELEDEGVKVLVGAHGQREGLGAHWELWMLEQGGMTPMEALRAATLDGAWYLGFDGDIGSLEEGKLADVLVLGENPLEDIRSSREVEQVILGGRVYDAETLDQLYPEMVEREPLFWERGDDGRLLTAPGRDGM